MDTQTKVYFIIYFTIHGIGLILCIIGLIYSLIRDSKEGRT
jgi:hypothetical protein